MTPSQYAGICVNTYEGRHGHVKNIGAIMTNRFIAGHSQLFIWENDTECVLSFQGSNGERDWKDNFHFLPIFARRITPPNGKLELIHSGFWRNYEPLRKFVREVIDRQKKQIVITGHSLGGANALLCLADVKRNLHLSPDCYSFAAPRVGNKAFYDFIENYNVYHYKNNNDLVCNVPFAIFGYHDPYRIEISDGPQQISGWTPLGNWKDHYPIKYYNAMVKYEIEMGNPVR